MPAQGSALPLSPGSCTRRLRGPAAATHGRQPWPLWQRPGASLPAARGLRLQTLQVDSLMLQEWFVLQPVSWPGAGPRSPAGLGSCDGWREALGQHSPASTPGPGGEGGRQHRRGAANPRHHPKELLKGRSKAQAQHPAPLPWGLSLEQGGDEVPGAAAGPCVAAPCRFTPLKAATHYTPLLKDKQEGDAKSPVPTRGGHWDPVGSPWRGWEGCCNSPRTTRGTPPVGCFPQVTPAAEPTPSPHPWRGAAPKQLSEYSSIK